MGVETVKLDVSVNSASVRVNILIMKLFYLNLIVFPTNQSQNHAKKTQKIKPISMNIHPLLQ